MGARWQERIDIWAWKLSGLEQELLPSVKWVDFCLTAVFSNKGTATGTTEFLIMGLITCRSNLFLIWGMPPACSEWKLLERCRTAWLWAAPAKLWILGTEVDPVLRQEAAWSQHHFAVADGPQLPGSRYRVCPSAVVQPMCCVPLRWDTPMCVHLRFASREMLQACLVTCGRERRGKHYLSLYNAFSCSCSWK